MDLREILKILERTEQRVAAGERAVDTQRRHLAKLEARGADIALARQLLKNLEETQALLIAQRERLIGTASYKNWRISIRVRTDPACRVLMRGA